MEEVQWEAVEVVREVVEEVVGRYWEELEQQTDKVIPYVFK